MLVFHCGAVHPLHLAAVPQRVRQAPPDRLAYGPPRPPPGQFVTHGVECFDILGGKDNASVAGHFTCHHLATHLCAVEIGPGFALFVYVGRFDEVVNGNKFVVVKVLAFGANQSNFGFVEPLHCLDIPSDIAEQMGMVFLHKWRNVPAIGHQLALVLEYREHSWVGRGQPSPLVASFHVGASSR